jgi:hypothetical protein
MRTLIYITAIIVAFSISCKTKKASTDANNSSNQTTQSSKTAGTVSHQYSSSGCAVVIIVKTEEGQDPLTLIPAGPIPSEFDKDGLLIYFNYRLLKMPNPAGCTIGIPAEITDISKKK